MGYKVTREQYIRLEQIEKQFGDLTALDAVRTGFEYGVWAILKSNKNKTDIELSMAHWELIPPWIRNMKELEANRKKGIPLLNATSEKILSSKMFRDAALNRRCLVIASWFFEWRHYQPPGTKKPGSYPYVITLPDKEYFYMAGIWQPWTDRETGETIDSFAIITTNANNLMEQIHNTKKRMPTILTEELAYEWIMADLTEERIQEIASFQLPADEMEAHSINKEFRTAEKPTRKFHYPELPELV